jgi:hypothetical protein
VTIISAIAIAVSFHGLFQLLSISTVLLTVWVPARQLDQERPEGWSDVQGNKVSALPTRKILPGSEARRARAGSDMGGRPEEGRSQQRLVLMLHRHPPLEAGATRAVDPEQEAGPGCGLHVASHNAAALVGLDEPAELVIDAHPHTPSVEVYYSTQIQASTGRILSVAE